MSTQWLYEILLVYGNVRCERENNTNDPIKKSAQPVWPYLMSSISDSFVAIKQYNPPIPWMKIVRRIVHIPPMANNIINLAHLDEILQMSASLKGRR
jgi:hypothetical protein